MYKTIETTTFFFSNKEKFSLKIKNPKALNTYLKNYTNKIIKLDHQIYVVAPAKKILKNYQPYFSLYLPQFKI